MLVPVLNRRVILLPAETKKGLRDAPVAYTGSVFTSQLLPSYICQTNNAENSRKNGFSSHLLETKSSICKQVTKQAKRQLMQCNEYIDIMETLTHGIQASTVQRIMSSTNAQCCMLWCDRISTMSKQ